MYKRKDHYWKKAKNEGYRSRAAYKLLEIQKKHRVLKKGDTVLDIGCAPGGWLQVIATEVGPSGRVVGVDRLSVKPLPYRHVLLLKGDMGDPELQERVKQTLGKPVHVVTSDMSPDLTGVSFQDHCRCCELVRSALDFSREVLAPGGTFLAKLFQGEELDPFVHQVRAHFEKTKRVVPGASRKGSSEIYVLAQGFKGRSS